MIRQYAVKQDGVYIYSTLGFNIVELEYFVNHSAHPNLVFDEDAAHGAGAARISSAMTGVSANVPLPTFAEGMSCHTSRPSLSHQ